jgi:hypothetical protein
VRHDELQGSSRQRDLVIAADLLDPLHLGHDCRRGRGVVVFGAGQGAGGQDAGIEPPPTATTAPRCSQRGRNESSDSCSRSV